MLSFLPLPLLPLGLFEGRDGVQSGALEEGGEEERQVGGDLPGGEDLENFEPY